MRGERAYWCSRGGGFYARVVFPPGEGSVWVLLSTGENLYWYTFSGGGFSGGKFYAGGNSMLQHRHTLTACGPSDGKEVKDVFGRPGARVRVGSAR